MPNNINSSRQQKALVFIDSTVTDYESLAAAVEPGTEVIILDRTRNAIGQITEVLASRHSINAVHILSHGSPGCLQLGNTQLNSDNLHTYAPQLQQWRNSLTDNADILLYGCDVGGNLSPNPLSVSEKGLINTPPVSFLPPSPLRGGDGGGVPSFLQQLSEYTGADVAASDDLTGSATKGGDWELEVNVGNIESSLAFQPEGMAGYEGVLATLPDVAAGDVTGLINAINSANDEITNPGVDTINLLGGTYTLTSGPYNYTSGINWGDSGLPVITSEIIINGNSATIARDTSASTTFRLFTIGGSSGKLTLNDITLENGNVTGSSGGSAPDAGAISNINGTVNINNSTLRNNAAGDDGGAIANFGTMNIQNSTISNNTAQGDGGSVDGGGAIENDGASATLNLTNTTISGNIHNGSGIGNSRGGAIRNRNSARLNILNSTIFNNTANSGTGGGIFVESGTVTVKNSIAIGNTATSNPDVSGTFTSNNANIIGDTTGSTSFGSDITGVGAGSVLNPTLAINGGPTKTHALVTGSPAIDAAKAADAPTTDQRGMPRPLDGNIDGTATADIGAYEIDVNKAPVLSGGTATLSSINEDETLATNTGMTVADLIAGLATDDNSDPLGIAVTGVDNSKGTWQFSTDGGTAWTPFGALSDSNATVLGWTSLYSGFVAGIPNSQGWFQFGTNPPFGNQTASGNLTNLVTRLSSGAGYSNYKIFSPTLVNAAFPILDRTQGFTVRFDGKLNSEYHSSDDNSDGLIDRSGLSLIAVSSDPSKAIELSFWPDEIWIKNDGPNVVPVPDPTRTLFTHSSTERAFGSTAPLTRYELSVLGDNYTFKANGSQILTGVLRDYQAFDAAGAGLPYDPYEQSNFLFLGDNTSSGSSNFDFKRIALQTDTRIRFVPNTDYNGTVNPGITFRAWDTTNGLKNGQTGVNASVNGGQTAFSSTTTTASITVNPVNDAPNITVPGNQTVNQDTNLVVPGISIADPDAGTGILEVNVSAANGVLTLSSVSGLTFSTGDGTADSSLQFKGTLADINSALNNLTYKGNTNFNGTDSINISVDDQGNTGSGGSLTDNDAIDINVTGIPAPAGALLVNEIVTDPQQDWSTNNFNGTPGGGTISQGVDEWVELYIGKDGLNLTNWKIELIDGSDVIGDLTNNPATRAFQVINYISSSGGNFSNTKAGDYLVLGNVASSGQMSNNITIVLKDHTGAVIDQVQLGGGAAPNGNATSIGDQAVARVPNATDTNNDASDFRKQATTLGASNNIPEIQLLETATNIPDNTGSVNFGTTPLGAVITKTFTVKNTGFSDLTLNSISPIGTGFSLSSPFGSTTIAPNQSTSFSVQLDANNAGTFNGNISFGNNDADENPFNFDISGIVKAPEVSITPGTNPNEQGTINGTLNVKLSTPAPTGGLTINFTPSGTANNPADYSFAAGPNIDSIAIGSIVISAGKDTATINVVPVDDNLIDPGETVDLTLTNGTNYTVSATNNTATLTIIDNDSSIQFSQANYQVNENGTVVGVAITLNRTGVTTNTSNIDVQLTNGTATGTDFNNPTQNIIFAANETTKTVVVPITEDNLVEGNENLTLTLANASANTAIGPQNTATLDIIDNDSSIQFSQANYQVNENGTVVGVAITLNRTGVTTNTSNIDVQLTNGTATGTDFNNPTQNIIFAANETTKTVVVPITEDNLVEGNENLTLTLANASANTAIGPQNTATLDIIDNDSSIQFSQANYQVNENGTVVGVAITLNRTGVTTNTSNIDVQLTNGTATGTDFNNPTQNIIFAANETTKTVVVPITEDNLVEGNENLTLTLANASANTAIGPQNVATLTILDNDTSPSVAFSQANYHVNENGTVVGVAVTINRTGDPSGISNIDVQFSNGTATGGSDFNNAIQTINFAASETSKTIVVPITEDTLFEGNENLTLTLVNPSAGTNIGGQNTANLTIVDNDSLPTISIGDITVTEGNSGTTSANFNLILSATSNQSVTVLYATADGTATTADNDYNAVSNQAIAFNPGETSKTISVAIKADIKVENNENFFVNLIGVTNATIADNQGVGTINNDDTEEDCFCEQLVHPNLDTFFNEGKEGYSLVQPNQTSNTFSGTESDDNLIGTDVNDELDGLGGNDFLVGKAGSDNLYGHNGNDTIFGNSESASHTLRERDWISGNEGDDLLNGNQGNDVINGNQGNDTVRGGKDNDIVRGGQDNDQMWGDSGDDTLMGDKGNDTIFGGASNTKVGDANGRDLILGGSRDDFLNGNEGDDTVCGDEGNDTVRGGKNDDIVFGDAGNDLLFGDLGNDSLCGEDGDDTIYGGNGSSVPIGSVGEKDCLCGGNGNDLLFGNEGEDKINGDEGDDTLYGGKDNDTLTGGAGNDWLSGDLGNDMLRGGTGSDRFTLSPGKGTDIILDFEDNIDILELRGNLTFTQLTINQGSDGTLISITETSELLVTLKGVPVNLITQQDFVLVS